MNEMTLHFSSGVLTVNGHAVDVSSFDNFIKSELYNAIPDIKKGGKYLFYICNASWFNNDFFMEIRPGMGVFNGSVYLIDKSGDFFQAFDDWNKRANRKLLENESKRLIYWVRDKQEGGSETKINQPPYGVEWVYDWGKIAVQSNSYTFDCGIYITWN